jgi:4a-hydroxytetrahydrobiopterin dehydratase
MVEQGLPLTKKIQGTNDYGVSYTGPYWHIDSWSHTCFHLFGFILLLYYCISTPPAVFAPLRPVTEYLSMMPTKLESLDLSTHLEHLPGWQSIEGNHSAIQKEWTFKNFREAWAFMSYVAEEADRLDHHPDWQNAYNVVRITLTTHDAGGLTPLDIDLAKAIEAYQPQ